MRKDFTIKAIIGVLAVALLTHAAHAQGRGKGKPPQQPVQTAEDVAKKKALDAEYKNALKNIPAAAEKPAPWKSMR